MRQHDSDRPWSDDGKAAGMIRRPRTQKAPPVPERGFPNRPPTMRDMQARLWSTAVRIAPSPASQDVNPDQAAHLPANLATLACPRANTGTRPGEAFSTVPYSTFAESALAAVISRWRLCRAITDLFQRSKVAGGDHSFDQKKASSAGDIVAAITPLPHAQTDCAVRPAATKNRIN